MNDSTVEEVPRSTFAIASWLFLRILGLTYLFAFVSFWLQFPGLIGPDGVLPVESYLLAASNQLDWWDRMWLLPTLCWIDSSTSALHIQFFLGTLASATLMLGVFERTSAVLCWLLYLSLSIAGQTFLAFQWDSLLLEAGLLALLLAPITRERLSRATYISGLLLYRWLLFRLMFASGLVKLLSGDPSWRDLTALQYHYFSQPLPSLLAYYTHRAPASLHTASCLAMFVIELLVPFLIFGPRLFRHIAAAALLLLQILIAATGNYAYFNLLSSALCILLLDDQLLHRFVPLRLLPRELTPEGAKISLPVSPLRTLITQPMAFLLLFLSCTQLWSQLFGLASLPGPIRKISDWAEPFRSVNRYGLFAVMTTERPEIILEGSDDGKDWHSYELHWKPQSLTTPPSQVAPHQPRLDWQMWFAALGNHRQNPWFLNLVYQLLNGSEAVLELFSVNPFPEQPPKYLRALLYKYEFTSLHQKETEGKWWKRELAGFYLPAVTLQNFEPRNQ